MKYDSWVVRFRVKVKKKDVITMICRGAMTPLAAATVAVV